MPVRFWLLDEFRVDGVAEPRALGPLKQRRLLAALLMQPGRLLSIEYLQQAIWESPPSSARKAIQVYVSTIRGACPDLPLVTHQSGYVMQIDPESVDVHRFRDLLDQARSAEPKEERRLLGLALELCGADPLVGLTGIDYWNHAAERLTEERLGALERRIALDIAENAADAVIPELLATVGAYPLREHAYALLMRALDQVGRANDALGVFQNARRAIVAELGTEPGPELTKLHAELLRRDHDQAAGGGARIPAQLPPAVPDFAGRRDARSRISAQLTGTDRPPGPVVIDGAAGIGKTTLAIQAAHDVRQSFPDGQLFAALHGQTAPADPIDVLGGFLRALGVPSGELPANHDERTAMYRSLVADRRMLVVLDDAADAAQVRPLLPGTSSVAVLVTSRRRLTTLAGGAATTLDGMSAGSALGLLAGSVGGARVDAERDAANRIVRTCGGLPLAVRICAARLAEHPEWTLESFADRLEGGNVLDELRADDLGARAGFDLSYQHLDDATARAFRLCALAETETLDLAAVATIVDVPFAAARRLVAELSNLHLVEEWQPSRYGFHDLLRSYGHEQARRTDSAADRTAAVLRLFRYYHAGASRAYERLAPRRIDLADTESAAVYAPRFPDRSSALGWLTVEAENLGKIASQALGLAEPPLTELGELATVLANSCDLVGERRNWELFTNSLVDHAVRAGALETEAAARSCASAYSRRRADHDGVRMELRRAREIYRELGNREREARLLNNLAVHAVDNGQFTEGGDYLSAANELYEQIDDLVGQTVVAANLGDMANQQRDFSAALDHFGRAIEMARTVADERLIGFVLHGMAVAHDGLGQVDVAMPLHKESLLISERTSDHFLRGRILLCRAKSFAAQGLRAQAVADLDEALRVRKETNDKRDRTEIANLLDELR